MMEDISNKLSQLRELLERADLSVKINKSVFSLLDDLHHSMYVQSENITRLQANYRSLDTEVKRLRTNYSELMYFLSEIKK